MSERNALRITLPRDAFLNARELSQQHPRFLENFAKIALHNAEQQRAKIVSRAVVKRRTTPFFYLLLFRHGVSFETLVRLALTNDKKKLTSILRTLVREMNSKKKARKTDEWPVVDVAICYLDARGDLDALTHDQAAAHVSSWLKKQGVDYTATRYAFCMRLQHLRSIGVRFCSPKLR